MPHRTTPCPRIAWSAMLAATLVAGLASAAADPVRVEKVEAIEGDETVVRVTLSAPLGDPARGKLIPKGAGQPDRLTIDLPGVVLKGKRSREVAVGWGGVTRMRLGAVDDRTTRLVLDLTEPMRFDVDADGSAVNVTLRPDHGEPRHAAPDIPIQLRSTDGPDTTAHPADASPGR